MYNNPLCLDHVLYYTFLLIIKTYDGNILDNKVCYNIQYYAMKNHNNMYTCIYLGLIVIIIVGALAANNNGN